MRARLISLVALLVSTPHFGAAQNAPSLPAQAASQITQAQAQTQTQTQTQTQAVQPTRSAARWARELGLNRGSPQFRYAKRQSGRDQVVFTNVEFGPKNAVDGRASRLVVSVDRANAGAGPVVRIEGGVMETSRPNPIRFDSLTIDQLRSTGGRNLGEALTAVMRRAPATSPAPRTRPAFNIIGNWHFERLSQIGLTPNEALSVETITLTQVGEVEPGKFVLQGARLTGLKVGAGAFQVGLDSLDIEEPASALISRIFAPPAAPVGMAERKPGLGLKWQDMALKRFDVRGLTVRSNEGAEASSQAGSAARLSDFRLGRMTILDMSSNWLGRFSAEDFNLNAIMGAGTGQFKLARFAVEDVNIDHWRRFGSYLARYFRKPSPKPADDEEGAAAADASPGGDNTKLSEVLKGGPLDGGIGKFEVAGLDLNLDGIAVTMDRLAWIATRQPDGLITKASMPLGTFSVAVTDPSKTAGAAVKAVLGQINLQRIDMTWSAETVYDPTTDVMGLSNGMFEVGNFGRVGYGANVGGVGRFMRETSYRDLLSNIAGAGAGDQSNPAASAKAQMAMLARLYADMTLISGQVRLQDKGGIERVSRMASLGAAKAKSRTPEQVRQGWVQANRAQAGEKTGTALERQLRLAVARWIERSGTIEIAARPATPVNLGAAMEGKVSIEAMGLTVSNQPD
jgi:hypothetical protein